MQRGAEKLTNVCVVTTDLVLAQAPGRVLRDAGEAILQNSSLVDVSRRATLARAVPHDDAYIGIREPRRIEEIVAGIISFF